MITYANPGVLLMKIYHPADSFHRPSKKIADFKTKTTKIKRATRVSANLRKTAPIYEIKTSHFAAMLSSNFKAAKLLTNPTNLF